MAMTVVNWTSAVRSMPYAMAVEAKGGYDARMPIAGPGLVVVHAGEPDRTPGMAVASSTMVRSSGTALVEQKQGRGKLVKTGMSGPLRTIRKDRRLMVLSGKWRCMYCKAFGERSSESTTCSSCGAPRRGTEVGEANAKEVARYEARKKSSVGRRLNKAGCGGAALVQVKVQVKG